MPERDSSSHFRYRPLILPDAIRVLQLHPSTNFTQPIHCSLTHTTLSECDVDLVSHYSALSYVWGAAEDTREIFVDGEKFIVTYNLWDALLNLQDSNRIITVWADAICINQEDIEERNHQVRMMGHIYSIAKHTVIYLGQTNDHVTEIIHHISKLDSDKRKEAIQLAQEPGMSSISDLSQETIFQATKELLSRPWFKRVWIFQELVLSRDPWVQCGQYRLKWKSLVDFLRSRVLEVSTLQTSSLHHSAEGYEPEFVLLNSLNDSRIQYQEAILGGKSRLTLYELLRSRRGAGVTDPHMIFGHMGVAGLPTPDQADTFSLAVDYKREPVEVFAAFAKMVIDWTGHFCIFSYAQYARPSSRVQGLPSWAPDWTIEQFGNPDMIYETGNYSNPDQADAHRSYKIHSWIPDSNLLTIVTQELKTITHTSKLIPWDVKSLISLGDKEHIFYTDFSTFYSNIENSRNSSDFAGYSEALNFFLGLYIEVYDLYCKVLGSDFLGAIRNSSGEGDAGGLLSNLNKYYSMSDSSQNWAGRISEAKGNLEHPISHLLFLHTFQKKRRSIVGGRRIAVFESGQTGVVPESARAGDLHATFDYCGTKDNKVGTNYEYVFRPITPDRGESLQKLDPGVVGDLQASLDKVPGRMWSSKRFKRPLNEEIRHCKLVGEGAMIEHQLLPTGDLNSSLQAFQNFDGFKNDFGVKSNDIHELNHHVLVVH